MEESKKSIWVSALLWGFATAVVIILLNAIYYGMDDFHNSTKGYIGIALQVLGIFVAIYTFRKGLQEDMPFTYGKSVGLGVATALVYSLIMAGFTYVMMGIIDPGLTEEMLMKAEETMVERGVDDALIEQQLAMQEKMLKPAILAGISIFGNMFYGLIISLILSAFLKKKNKDDFDAAMREINDEE